MEQSDPDLSMDQEALPLLSREALHRIEQAEKDAKERYDLDKLPYFPTNPDFSFFESDVVRARERILQYLAIYAHSVLEAHLKEYLEVEPLAVLLTNRTLITSVTKRVWTLTDELWAGYGAVLFLEPSSRRARYSVALADGTLDRHPELEPWRYPDQEQWADSRLRFTQPDSEMARLDKQRNSTVLTIATDLIRQYQEKAAPKFGIKLEPARRSEENQEDHTPVVERKESKTTRSGPVRARGEQAGTQPAVPTDAPRDFSDRAEGEAAHSEQTASRVTVCECAPPDKRHSENFTSDAGRNSALADYMERRRCSAASLARTARVDPADLSRWKPGSLSAGSDKKARIENALRNNDAPTPPAKRSTND